MLNGKSEVQPGITKTKVETGNNEHRPCQAIWSLYPKFVVADSMSTANISLCSLETVGTSQTTKKPSYGQHSGGVHACAWWSRATWPFHLCTSAHPTGTSKSVAWCSLMAFKCPGNNELWTTFWLLFPNFIIFWISLWQASNQTGNREQANLAHISGHYFWLFVVPSVHCSRFQPVVLLLDSQVYFLVIMKYLVGLPSEFPSAITVKVLERQLEVVEQDSWCNAWKGNDCASPWHLDFDTLCEWKLFFIVFCSQWGLKKSYIEGSLRSSKDESGCWAE